VLALGTISVGFPLGVLEKAGIKTYIIGDANEPQGIAEAVREGFLTGISI
jgi:hypothetical protein